MAHHAVAEDEVGGLERRHRDEGKELSPGLTWRMCRSKSRYESEHIAERYARKAEEQHGVRMRVYECGNCGGFHLSSKALRGT